MRGDTQVLSIAILFLKSRLECTNELPTLRISNYGS
jgi:hypothetical protein